jgi:plasmid stabilization system protein ParE
MSLDVNRTPFIAVYRIQGGIVQIFRLLHGAQQWP